MKIINIETEKRVKKREEEIEKEQKESSKWFVNQYKIIPLKEPFYIVEMSMEELQLISFYLELERRKPIMNVEINTELNKEKNNE